MPTHLRVGPSVAFMVSLAALLGACSSSSPSGPVGGPVEGPPDMHCGDGDGGVTATVVGECMMGGAPPDGGAVVSDYGDTLNNAEGDDDDCKYHVVWTSTPVRENTGVTFNVTLTRLADGAAATGAGVRGEVFLSDTHPAAPPPQATESSGGKYKLGPITFDMPGKWTVRFHFFETCDDAPEDSPHGHAAFFVNVPDPNGNADAGAGN